MSGQLLLINLFSQGITASSLIWTGSQKKVLVFVSDFSLFLPLLQIHNSWGNVSHLKLVVVIALLKCFRCEPCEIPDHNNLGGFQCVLNLNMTWLLWSHPAWLRQCYCQLLIYFSSPPHHYLRGWTFCWREELHWITVRILLHRNLERRSFTEFTDFSNSSASVSWYLLICVNVCVEYCMSLCGL